MTLPEVLEQIWAAKSSDALQSALQLLEQFSIDELFAQMREPMCSEESLAVEEELCSRMYDGSLTLQHLVSVATFEPDYMTRATAISLLGRAYCDCDPKFDQDYIFPALSVLRQDEDRGIQLGAAQAISDLGNELIDIEERSGQNKHLPKRAWTNGDEWVSARALPELVARYGGYRVVPDDTFITMVDHWNGKTTKTCGEWARLSPSGWMGTSYVDPTGEPRVMVSNGRSLERLTDGVDGYLWMSGELP